ncbi:MULTISPECIES: replication initiation factor domain-containing protein [unclassified Undibacterium]|uniref:replication initiation factor domain-containing protein n=1 Tax=unclassified Undibacterium TaxID=2630295 RepID=UPI002AC8DF2B|nr:MULTISPECIES: replication initiation factor domain-containing protein [unclassified Undibacterium]MEB0137642.1 replication initiation factor domain-containing protein [Undibacterium sp. CCC2.1]MEB0170643.1 replication initiation factor domain-containing protein [Undibacterium sp. CCC1.1]MEB0174584.1 replication initiation factor domain-containing protein [Undibacterium sp. CCC3.4]MEB0213619.1 replication initiation factor domain-containing protein [Undibacterium sp. 5I2]WPX43787.1 replicati
MKRLDDDLRNQRGTRLPARSDSEDGQPQGRVASSKKQAFAPSAEPLQANRGVHEQDYIDLVLADGAVKQVPKRAASNSKVFIDWLTFTANVDAFLRFNGYKAFTDDDIASAISLILHDMFGDGFGISKKNGFGMHFHKESFVIGDNMGIFCIGHRNNRFLVSISGDGWLNANPDAAEKLHKFLNQLNDHGADVRISRVDIAADYYTDGPTHDEFEEAYHRGEFVRQQRHINSKDAWPNYQVYGCIHTNRGLQAGITDAIGVRTSDLYLRRYDKGRQLGDPSSPWVRVELEIKNKDTIIPLDVLLMPETFFCQYPWLRNLRDSTAEKMETKRQRAEITVEASKKIIKTQFGKYLRVLRGLVDSDEELINQLQSDEDEWPKRLAKVAPQIFVPLHKQPIRSNVLFADEFATSDYGYTDGSGFTSSHTH